MRKPTVLVVEDDEDTREALSSVLSRALDVHIEAAASGEEALERLEGRRDDIRLLMTDERMGELAGSDLIRWVRQTRPELPCVLMSAFHNGATVAEAAGADLFLSKPFHLGEWAPVLRRLLESGRAVSA